MKTKRIIVGVALCGLLALGGRALADGLDFGRGIDHVGALVRLETFAATPEQVAAATDVNRPHYKTHRNDCSDPCGGNHGPAPSPWARCRARGRGTHLVSANRLGDVLDAMAAKRTVIKIELVFDMLVDGM